MKANSFFNGLRKRLHDHVSDRHGKGGKWWEVRRGRKGVYEAFLRGVVS